MTRLRAHAVSIALALLCVALAGWIYLQLADAAPPPASSVAAPAPRAAPQAARTPEAFVLPPLRDFAEIVQRPLFAATRRPAPLAPTASPAPQDELGALELVGIVVTASERFALVQLAAAPKPLRIGLGQALRGWAVQSIERDRVVLAQGDRRLELRFKDRAPSESRPN